jgi:hypothetical protein
MPPGVMTRKAGDGASPSAGGRNGVSASVSRFAGVFRIKCRMTDRRRGSDFRCFWSPKREEAA